MITIESILMPTPSTFQVSIMDLSHSWRNADGEIRIELVGDPKRKLEITYSYLSQSDLALMLNAIKAVPGPGGNRPYTFFDVEYPDPELNSDNTITCYCGDRSIGMITYKDGVPYWKDIKFSLIEK